MVAGGVGLAPFATLAESLARAGTPTTLFYGARSAGELFYLDFFERLGVTLVLATEDGSRGARGRVTAPLEQALARAAPRPDVADLCVRPRADARRRVATLAGRIGQPLRSVGRAGHGLRPRRLLQLRRPGARRRRATHFVRSCIGGPVFDGADIVWDLMMDLRVRIGSLELPNPIIAASGCFGYGLEYEEVVDLSMLGGVAVKGLFLKRARGTSAAAHRRDARRAC